MYVCESLTIKNAECQRIDAVYLWSWRRLLRAPWTARRSNQSFLKESALNIHHKEWCWSPILWPLDEKTWLFRKDLAARKGWGQEQKGVTGWDGWIASLTHRTWVSASSRRWWRLGNPGVLQFMGSQSKAQFGDWTTKITITYMWNIIYKRIQKNLFTRWNTQMLKTNVWLPKGKYGVGWHR